MSEQENSPSLPVQERDASVKWAIPQEALDSIARSIASQFGGRLSCVETKVASLASAATLGETSTAVEEDEGEERQSLGERNLKFLNFYRGNWVAGRLACLL